MDVYDLRKVYGALLGVTKVHNCCYISGELGVYKLNALRKPRLRNMSTKLRSPNL